MRRSRHSRHIENGSSSNSESSEYNRDSTRRVAEVKYIRVEVAREGAAKGSDSSDRSSTHPPRKVKDVSVGVSRTKAAMGSDSSDPICTAPFREAKDVDVDVSRRKTTKGLDMSNPKSSSLPRKAKAVSERVSETTTTNGTDKSDRSSPPRPRKTRNGGAHVSETKTANNSNCSAVNSHPLHGNTRSVGTRISETKAMNGSKNSYSSSTPLPSHAKRDDMDYSKTRETNGSDYSDQTFYPPPRKPREVNAGIAESETAKSANSRAQDSSTSPRDFKDVGVEVPGREETATTTNMTTVRVSKPAVRITVNKPPPSLYSKWWNILLWSMTPKITWFIGALQDPQGSAKAGRISSQGSSVLEDKQAPTLQQVYEPSKSSEENDAPHVRFEADAREPPAKRRKIIASDSMNQVSSNFSPDKPQGTTTFFDRKLESHSEAELFMSQTETKSTAIARIAVNTYKQSKRRPYIVCRHLTEATNDIGLQIFCSYPEDQRLCLSLYGLSFIIALTERYVKDTKVFLRETLKCGAMVLNDDGWMAYPCREVVTTLKRRLVETDEVSVITETYLRRSATVNQQAKCGIASSTKNITSHFLTAEFETFSQGPAQGFCNEVLFNTACFENLWRCPFNRQSTYVGSFLNNWTDKMTVVMMRRTSILPYSFYPDRQVDVVSLPYADDATSMTLIVQRSPSSGDLSVLTPDDVMGFIHGARNVLLTLHLPKFCVTSSVDVADLMTQIACADSRHQEMRFLHARMETSIAVDEGNWRVTCSERTGSMGNPVTVVVDRPFYFFITENRSGLILYVGRVTSLA